LVTKPSTGAIKKTSLLQKGSSSSTGVFGAPLEVKDFPTLIIYEYGFEVKREVGYFNIKAM